MSSNPPIPRNIEVLVKKASVDAEFRKELHKQRSATAQTIGLELTPAEKMIMDQIPELQLEKIIAGTRVERYHRKVFLGKTAALMLAAIGATTFELHAGGATEGIRPEGSKQVAQIITSAKDEKVDDFICSNNLDDLIYNGQFKTADQKFSRLEGEKKYPEIGRILKELTTCDQMIIDSFKDDIGKEIVIKTNSGDISGTVLAVGKSNLKFKQKAGNGEITVKLNPRFFAGSEIMPRLQAAGPEAKAIYAGAICVKRRKFSKAKAYFEKAGILSHALLKHYYVDHPLVEKKPIPESKLYEGSFGLR